MIEGNTISRQSVAVGLGDRAYNIIIGEKLLASLGQMIHPLLPRQKVAIVSDETVYALHGPALEKGLTAAAITFSTIILPSGEKTKSFKFLEQVTDKLLEDNVERNDVIIAFGGGVIGDLTGFASSILRRGCSFIQIPTTLLAQVDSSVGGKTAINAGSGKNLIGAFHQPIQVIADIDILRTLPQRHLRAGYAEIAKYGLLGDAAFWAWLERYGNSLLSGDADLQIEAIARSVRAKAKIVEADETEQGQRALLNLGHSFAHALEALTDYSDRLFHGEAVAIGIVLAFEFSAFLGHGSPDLAERIAIHFKQVGLPAYISDIQGLSPSAEQMLALLYQDKKTKDGALTFILARNIGDAFIARQIDPAKVNAFLNSKLS